MSPLGCAVGPGPIQVGVLQGQLSEGLGENAQYDWMTRQWQWLFAQEVALGHFNSLPIIVAVTPHPSRHCTLPSHSLSRQPQHHCTNSESSGVWLSPCLLVSIGRSRQCGLCTSCCYCRVTANSLPNTEPGCQVTLPNRSCLCYHLSKCLVADNILEQTHQQHPRALSPARHYLPTPSISHLDPTWPQKKLPL